MGSNPTSAAVRRDVPRAALRFRVPACEFALEANGPDSKTVPVKMIARTGQPIEHWFFGKVVHDMAGMKLHKPRLPIDYVHDCDQILGYLNKFDTDTGDLVVSGALTPFDAADRASEVIYKAREGVPYEASIDFGGDGIRIEELSPNATAEVNGYTLTGPAAIIREWPLRGVAVCPYGADMNTETKLAAEARTVSVTTFTKGPSTMATETTPAEAGKTPTPTVEADKDKTPAAPAPEAGNKPAVEGQPAAGTAEATPATAPPAATQQQAKPAAPAVEAKLTHVDYTTAFGDVGARWFLEGKPFAAATTEFVAKLSADHATALKAKDDEITALKGRLDALPRGDDGVTFAAADAPRGAAAAGDGTKPKAFAAAIQASLDARCQAAQQK